MKTIRFSQLVDIAGHPEVHLALVKPEQDKGLQRAIKSHRVVTVFQTLVGHETDHGEEGFHPGDARQYLLFPRSVKRFAGRRIVGVKYELLDDVAPAEAYPSKPKTDKPARKVEKVKRPPARKDPPKKSKAAKKTIKTTPIDNAEVKSLKTAVRKAIKTLKRGKQVAAFDILRGIVD